MDVERLRIDRSSRASGPRRRRRRRFVPKLVIALLLVGAAGFFFRDWIADRVAQARLPIVETALVVRRPPASAAAIAGTAANGYVVARVRAALSADAPGRIVEMNVEEGQAVPKGFVVARLYFEEHEAALRRAESEVDAGKAGLARARAEKESSKAALRELESSFAAANASVREIEADRELARLQLDRADLLFEQGIATVEARDEARARFEVVDARLATARAQLESAEAALEEGRARVTVAAAQVEEAIARIEALVAARDLARATLQKTEVRAPFDGIVVLKDAEVGEVVSPNSQAGGSARGAVATMVDFKTLEAQAEVPESSIGAVEIGKPVRIILDAFPDHVYDGRVDRIWPTANRQKGTIEVRATFDDPDERLRPEMGLRIVFLDPGSAERAGKDRHRGDVLVVPEATLVRADGEAPRRALDGGPAEELDGSAEPGEGALETESYFAFVVRDGVVERRRVEVHEIANSRAFVASGLEEDERLVIDPPPDLEDGDRVYVMEREE